MEYFIDTESINHTKKYSLLNIEDYKSNLISHNWMWSNPLVNDAIRIYKGYQMSSMRNGLIIMVNEKTIIVQVADDTNIGNVLHLNAESEMYMSLIAGWGMCDDGTECEFTESVNKRTIEILYQNVIFIILLDTDNNSVKIYIDEFNHGSIYDSTNARLNDLSLKCPSDPETEDEYNEPICCCDTIQLTQVDDNFYEIDCNKYSRNTIIYQILNRGTNLVLVVKEYDIRFNHMYQDETISQSQVHFSLPRLDNFVFDKIIKIDSNIDTYTFYIYYTNGSDEEHIMMLKLVNSFSKELDIMETYDDTYCIYRSSCDKIQIYPSHYSKSAPKWKKLYGMIAFDVNDNEDKTLENAFVKSNLTRR